MPVHNIVTHVHLRTLHPLDENRSLPGVEIEVHKLIPSRGFLPMELLHKTAPEGVRIGEGQLVLIAVRFKVGNMRLLLETVRRTIDTLLGGQGRGGGDTPRRSPEAERELVPIEFHFAIRNLEIPVKD